MMVYTAVVNAFQCVEPADDSTKGTLECFTPETAVSVHT